MNIKLFVMRLADMHRVHPQQIKARCSQCNHEVAVFPSGQLIMEQHADVMLICSHCGQPTIDAPLAPGAEFEPSQTKRKK